MKLEYRQMVTADSLAYAAFDLRHTIQLHCEEALERAIAAEGLTPTGPPVCKETPMVWDGSSWDEERFGWREAREGEEPSIYEFRYRQYAEWPGMSRPLH